MDSVVVDLERVRSVWEVGSVIEMSLFRDGSWRKEERWMSIKMERRDEGERPTLWQLDLF